MLYRVNGGGQLADEIAANLESEPTSVELADVLITQPGAHAVLVYRNYGMYLDYELTLSIE